MHVTARAGSIRGELRHEGDRLPHLLGNLLEALLVDHVSIGHLERVGVADIQFVLTESPLAF
jgi:hypothetical protein